MTITRVLASVRARQARARRGSGLTGLYNCYSGFSAGTSSWADPAAATHRQPAGAPRED